MREFYDKVASVDLSVKRSKYEVLQDLINLAVKQSYLMADLDMQKPWGGFVRFSSGDADDFIEQFFPGLSPAEAKLGNDALELSPKFLLVAPDMRLSWQRHERRRERWAYITDGAYHRGLDPNNQGDLVNAPSGEVVQFEAQECHRLVGLPGDTYTLVAEIWQHTDASNPSEEADIERLADDFNR